VVSSIRQLRGSSASRWELYPNSDFSSPGGQLSPSISLTRRWKLRRGVGAPAGERAAEVDLGTEIRSWGSPECRYKSRLNSQHNLWQSENVSSRYGSLLPIVLVLTMEIRTSCSISKSPSRSVIASRRVYLIPLLYQKRKGQPNGHSSADPV